jgi:UDP-2-acetamido-2,6-beta-L-arabino-hexul-4-ose reductase
VYIDDLINEMFDALEGKEHRNGDYCYVPISHKVTLGEIIEHLKVFKQMPETLLMPEIPDGSFVKKLYSTYLSYLPPEKMIYSFNGNVDNRGNFTELIKTANCGQVSINVAKPGITRGEHWHNSKWEIFIVVSGHALIQERRIGINPETGKEYPVIEFEVTGEQMRGVQMLPGYTHSIKNLSDTENLVTVMWANESFNKDYPDTFYEQVDIH